MNVVVCSDLRLLSLVVLHVGTYILTVKILGDQSTFIIFIFSIKLAVAFYIRKCTPSFTDIVI